MKPSMIQESAVHRDSSELRRRRWIARVYATIVGGFTVAFLGAQFIGGLLGYGDPYQVEDPTTAELVALAALAVGGAGLLLGWWLELPGAVIALLGGLVSLVSGPVAGPVALLLMFGGALLLAVWMKERNDMSRVGARS